MHGTICLAPEDRKEIMGLEKCLRKVLEERNDGWEERADDCEDELEWRIGEAEDRYEKAVRSKKAAQEERARAEKVRQDLTQLYGSMCGGKRGDWERHADRGLMPEYTAEVVCWEGIGRSVACA